MAGNTRRLVGAVLVAAPGAVLAILLFGERRVQPRGATAGAASPADTGWPCSEWSVDRAVSGSLGLQWTYRFCGSEAGGGVIEFRFGNSTQRGVVVRYMAWLDKPARCAAEGSDWSGEAALAAGETTAWNEYAFRLAPGRRYRGELWMCVWEERAGFGRMIRGLSR